MALERRAGRGFDLKDLDPLLWELLLVWEAREQEHERVHAANLSQIIAALTKAP